MLKKLAALYRARLYNAARAVEEFNHTDDKVDVGLVDMGNYVKPCGSPACVLGHYAFRKDLQDAFELHTDKSFTGKDQFVNNIYRKGGSAAISFDHASVLEHFGLEQHEAEVLFSSSGCGVGYWDASSGNTIRTAKPAEVAAYLRRFADRRFPEALS